MTQFKKKLYRTETLIFAVHEFLKNFAGINFRKSPILKTFAGVNFRELTFWGVKKGIYFREFGQNSRNSRNFLPTKISSLKVSGMSGNSLTFLTLAHC